MVYTWHMLGRQVDRMKKRGKLSFHKFPNSQILQNSVKIKLKQQIEKGLHGYLA